MMLPTAELRWFFRGDVPLAMARWIRDGELWVQQPERVDEYLVLPGCPNAGIKLREGRFEVKVQTAAPAAVSYPNGVRGHRDAWVKWSRSIGEVAADRAFWSAEGERWTTVRKRRVLRGFSLDGSAYAGAEPREVPIDGDRPGRGCGVEITEVAVGVDTDERWWTLGLEGFDASGEPAEALERVARMLFERQPPPLALTLESSYSYAVWLTKR